MKSDVYTVLLGEDDLEVRSYLETALRCQGYTVEVARDGEEVLAALQNRDVPVSAVVLDLIMPRRTGIDALKEIRRCNRDLPVIIISGDSSPLNIVDAMKNGANDFIAKPIKPEDLRKALKLALTPEPTASAEHPATKTDEPAGGQVFFGTSSFMRGLQSLIDQIGGSEAPVLIQGETGVGKEVFARELHLRSPRAKKPFLKLNCAALPSELVESELFGYERGAFTGAFQKKPGMFEMADGGAILLDEIGDMDFKLQAKLLQVLQDQEFQRLGGRDTIRVDVRVIAATHRNLEKAILENTFREDLYYRLNVINVHVPPLRERKEDIIPMAEFLIRKRTVRGAAAVQLPATLKEVFLSYHWPGNVRELENVIRKFLIFPNPALIQQDLLPKLKQNGVNGSNGANGSNGIIPAVAVPAVESQGTPSVMPVNFEAIKPPQGPTRLLEQVANAKREAERSAILATLKVTNWNRKQAAVLLDIDYKALLYKMKKLSIKKEKKPRGAAHKDGATDVAPIAQRESIAC